MKEEGVQGEEPESRSQEVRLDQPLGLRYLQKAAVLMDSGS
jgi:hypothetical protein